MSDHEDITAIAEIQLTRYKRLVIRLVAGSHMRRQGGCILILQIHKPETVSWDSRFETFVPFSALSSVVSAMRSAETLAVEKGLIEEPVDNDAADVSGDAS